MLGIILPLNYTPSQENELFKSQLIFSITIEEDNEKLHCVYLFIKVEKALEWYPAFAPSTQMH
jgi:hypothetical protein